MPNIDFGEDELAAVAKATDVHRQALVRKLQRISDTNPSEQNRTLEEIRACSSASAKMRRVHDAQLGRQVKAAG